MGGLFSIEGSSKGVGGISDLIGVGLGKSYVFCVSFFRLVKCGRVPEG